MERMRRLSRPLFFVRGPRVRHDLGSSPPPRTRWCKPPSIFLRCLITPGSPAYVACPWLVAQERFHHCEERRHSPPSRAPAAPHCRGEGHACGRYDCLRSPGPTPDSGNPAAFAQRLHQSMGSERYPLVHSCFCTDACLDQRWFDLFMRWHPTLKRVNLSSLEAAHAKAATPEAVAKTFGATFLPGRRGAHHPSPPSSRNRRVNA